MNNKLITFAIGVLVGYRGINFTVHLTYLAIIAGLVAYHVISLRG